MVNVTLYRDVDVQPYRYNQGWAMGGPCGPGKDSHSDERLRHMRANLPQDPYPMDPTPLPECALTELPITRLEHAIYGGPLFDHFGHFTAESLARLWALNLPDAVPRDAPLLFTRGGSTNLRGNLSTYPAFVDKVFQRLGLGRDRLRYVNEDRALVRRLYVPDQAAGLCRPHAPELLTFLSQNFQAPSSTDDGGADLLYVSRRDFRFRGNYLGEAVLIDGLKAAGFRIMEPQHYTLDEQLAAYRRAKHIIFNEGSAVHSLIYAHDITAKIQLLVRRKRPIFQYQLEQMQIDHVAHFPRLYLPLFTGRMNWQMVVFPLIELAATLSQQVGVTIPMPRGNVLRPLLIEELRAMLKRYSWEPSYRGTAIEDLRAILNRQKRFGFLLDGLDPAAPA